MWFSRDIYGYSFLLHFCLSLGLLLMLLLCAVRQGESGGSHHITFQMTVCAAIVMLRIHKHLAVCVQFEDLLTGYQ